MHSCSRLPFIPLLLPLPSGGDLSYHLEKEGRFQLPRVRLYLAEIALALEYLKEKKIIHRDVKPANMLLDSQGHIHLTDFNVACIVRPNVPVTSTTGTKPYMGEGERPHLLTPPPSQHPPSTLPHMLTILSHSHTHTAPEVLHPTSTGYTYAVDWWSLGVSAYEMLRGQVRVHSWRYARTCVTLSVEHVPFSDHSLSIGT